MTDRSPRDAAAVSRSQLQEAIARNTAQIAEVEATIDSRSREAAQLQERLGEVCRLWVAATDSPGTSSDSALDRLTVVATLGLFTVVGGTVAALVGGGPVAIAAAVIGGLAFVVAGRRLQDDSHERKESRGTAAGLNEAVDRLQETISALGAETKGLREGLGEAQAALGVLNRQLEVCDMADSAYKATNSGARISMDESAVTIDGVRFPRHA